MRGTRVKAPAIDSRLLRVFHAYCVWYLRRHFHAIRLSSRPKGADGPLVVVMNHPSWWDPLIALRLALHLFPERRHYAPIDAAALTKYKFFAKLGFFGIEPGTAKGAAQFLRAGEAILSDPQAVLWVTAQGRFADPRVRPLMLRHGVEKLLERVPTATALPLAIEYPFWEEKYPEALVRFGAPVREDVRGALETAQNELAAASIARSAAAFETLQDGREGVGGVYGLWQRLTRLERAR